MNPSANTRRKLARSILFLSLAAPAAYLCAGQMHATAAPRPAACADAPAAPVSAPLVLKKDDHIAILGNVFPDRMQFDGYFETLINARFPQQGLVFRNLSASGDEVNTWQRSEAFGTREEWLKKTKADVIFAFYGYNESFKGAEGLPAFKADLDKFLKGALAADYSGKGAPRVVLFSPAADEKTIDPNFPDPKVNNANIALYAAAMAEVAKANGVRFVDLLAPSQDIYAKAAAAGKSLTINGHYLGEEAYKQLAPTMFRETFDETPPTGDFEKLRAAINEKNWQWHGRYRTIDGYNVYGGRSHMSYKGYKDGKQYINNVVMQEEMSQRDVLTANRDKVVWATAQGKELAPDDSNLPPVDQVQTNHPGPNPDASWPFLSGEDAIAKMTPAAHTKVNLFASEEQWPELVAPLQMAWDGKGRLWVSVWKNYPERTPTSKVGDSILIFEDTKGTGKADKCTHFIDDLNAPTGFQFYKDGILLMEAPDLWYVKDTSGGDHANFKERVLMGMDSADSHHTTNALAYDPGGAVYLSDGVFHRTQVETTRGPERNEDACIWRFMPRTGEFERYVAYGFANPHGKVFDYWGNDIITDATGNNSYFAPAFSGHIDYPAKHAGLKDFWARPSRPCPGTGLITSKHFPEDFWGNFLNCNVIGFQGIYRVKMEDDGSGVKGTSLENIVSSTDQNFRPSQVNTGPDGALYFTDWSNDIIGHLQHHLRDPNRDHIHGRIYRMTYEGRPLEKPPVIVGQPIPAVLELLKRPENQIRTLAKVELDKHPTAEVIAGLDKWAAGLDKADPAYEHHMMEALWVHQWQNVVDVDLLKRVLRSPEPHARAAATRVACYWRDRVREVLALLKVQATDENAQVRLEAVRAASFFADAQAADVALASLKYPTDYYLEYTLKETMKQLEKYWQPAVKAGKLIAIDNPAGLEYLGQSIKTDDLLKMPHSEGVLQAILVRPDVADAVRVSTLNELAGLKKASTLPVLLETMGLQRHGSPAEATLAKMLPMQPAPDLKAARETLVKLATAGADADVRQAAWAGIATADESIDKVWADGAKTTKGEIDVLSSIPLIFDQDIRAKAYDKVKPLLIPELPSDLTGGPSHPTTGRFVRISLPRRGTLTLAEVQVIGEGRNIALHGKAKQSSTLGGGDASHAIDGRTEGAYGACASSHTQENQNNPWWEVDLGAEQSIDSVVVWNRTDGNLGERLNGFTLEVLDGARHEAFKSANNPAPAQSATITVGNDVAGNLRNAAIKAAVSMNREQAATFASLVALIGKGDHVIPAARGIRTLQRKSWEKSPEVAPLAKSLVAWAKALPADSRTSQEYAETVQFAGDLAGMLPPADGAEMRKELKELRVAVFVLRTVREQMRYDTARLVVEAGKHFEIILENGDMMPHNLAVVNPGTRAKLAAESALMKPDALDSQGRAFMPRSPDILAATKMIEPGQRDTVKLTAPTKEGTYEYFCTYPGHWEIMWGTLIVTNDVDAYLEAHPNSAPAPTSHAATEHAHHHGA